VLMPGRFSCSSHFVSLVGYIFSFVVGGSNKWQRVIVYTNSNFFRVNVGGLTYWFGLLVFIFILFLLNYS
jgi:hypothetical protein